MTAEAASVLTQPGPTSSQTTRARIPRQRRNLEHINCAPCVPARNDANQMRADSAVTDLVAAARDGDKQAWDALVERYAPLVWSICRRHRLGRADADDVAQSVWLRLVGQLDRIREPAALPGWLATTTRRECIRISCAAQRTARHRLRAGLREPPRHPRRSGRAGTAGSRAARGAARSVQPAAVPRPAADRPAHRGPAHALRRHQHPAGHPRRQHRTHPQPLPGQDAPPPGHRRAERLSPGRSGYPRRPAPFVPRQVRRHPTGQLSAACRRPARAWSQ